jgi:DNA helicase HerA-like ATPase
VDLRDPLAVSEEMASLLLQTTFSFVKDRPQDGICLVAIDEAHLFFEHEQLTKDIIAFVAQLRKNYRVYLLLMSQQPGRFHPDILALSDVIICYRLESDTELDFLKKHKPAFAHVTEDIKKLKTGEGKAFLWSRVSTDGFLDKPRLVSIRPKVTEDRGKTATAF